MMGVLDMVVGMTDREIEFARQIRKSFEPIISEYSDEELAEKIDKSIHAAKRLRWLPWWRIEHALIICEALGLELDISIGEKDEAI